MAYFQPCAIIKNAEISNSAYVFEHVHWSFLPQWRQMPRVCCQMSGLHKYKRKIASSRLYSAFLLWVRISSLHILKSVYISSSVNYLFMSFDHFLLTILTVRMSVRVNGQRHKTKHSMYGRWVKKKIVYIFIYSNESFKSKNLHNRIKTMSDLKLERICLITISFRFCETGGFGNQVEVLIQKQSKTWHKED